jgi:hypothetical protein
MALKRNVRDALADAYQRAMDMVEEQDNLENLRDIEIRIWNDSTRVFFTFSEENFVGSGVSSKEKTVEMSLATRIDQENF